jgi:hypothetical protein
VVLTAGGSAIQANANASVQAEHQNDSFSATKTTNSGYKTSKKFSVVLNTVITK